MSFCQQLRDAISGQIEDFFYVKWQSVLAMLLMIACLVGVAFLRIPHGNSGSWFWLQMVLLCVVLQLLSRAFPKR